MSRLFSLIAICYDKNDRQGFVLVIQCPDSNKARNFSGILKELKQKNDPISSKLAYLERFKVITNPKK